LTKVERKAIGIVTRTAVVNRSAGFNGSHTANQHGWVETAGPAAIAVNRDLAS
jgi:hypothetical protein